MDGVSGKLTIHQKGFLLSFTSELVYWDDCPVEGCSNKICLALDSDKCFVHTKGFQWWKLFRIWWRNEVMLRFSREERRRNKK